MFLYTVYPDKWTISRIATNNGAQRNRPSVRRPVSDNGMFTLANASDR